MNRHILSTAIAVAMAFAAAPLFAYPLLLWDMEPIDELGGGAKLTLHHPEFRDVAMVHDAPWEGNTCAFHTVFQDGDLYRMYYRGASYKMPGHEDHGTTCYAESKDGIHWTRPNLGICEFNGSKDNNIIMPTFCFYGPFIDTNPACPPEWRYKAMGGDGEKGVFLYVSPDGIHWQKAQEEPVFPKEDHEGGVIFYDSVQKRYVVNRRAYKPMEGFPEPLRRIKRHVSDDAIHWSEAEMLDIGPDFPAPNAPPVELYTQQILPYLNNPAVYVGLPKRYCYNRTTPYDAYAQKTGQAAGLSEGAFMTSRDGLHYKVWNEAFIRPGAQHDRWANRNTMCAIGIMLTKSDLEGAPPELSIYSTEGYYSDGPVRLRRHVIRQDGFVSVQAPLTGGSVTLKPLAAVVTETSQLPGRQGVTMKTAAAWSDTMLLLNASTSAYGSIRCEIRDEQNQPISGYTLDDAVAVYGDELDLPMVWKNGTDVSPLIGRRVILHFELVDADIYSLRFGHP